MLRPPRPSRKERSDLGVGLTVPGLLITALLAVLLALVAMGVGRYLTAVRLNRELRRYRAFVENSRDLIVVIDDAGIIRFASPSSAVVLGAPPEQVIGRSFMDFVHPDWGDVIADQWRRMLSDPGGRLDTPEFGAVRADGSSTFLHATGRNLLHDEAVRGVLTHAHDVSERRAALEALRATEEQFRQAQKMEAVGRLAGGIAHDFNNLLTAIQGYTRLLLDDLPPDSRMRSDLAQIEKSAERAASLTRQLLAFSRRQVLQPRVLELNGVIESMRDMMSRMLGPHIILDYDLSPDAGTVRADRSQLEQVVMNLLVNARDAMPDGGRVVVSTRSVTITEDEAASHPYLVIPGEYAELVVSDEGTGIPRDLLPLIFEPFFTTKEQGRGTGLGLSTVYGVVKQSGGYVWAQSGPGGGTTFRICLPRASDGAGAPASAPAAPEPVAARGETILVVEDEDAVRRLATRVLQRHGYKVVVAHDGRAALDICRGYDGPIHMVVTDVVMPGLDGAEVVSQLRAVRPGLKALFVSGYAREGIPDHGSVGPDLAFLEKPFSPGALARKVRDVLDGTVD